MRRPPAATKQKGEQVVDSGGLLEEEPDFLFEKRYDALALSPDKTGNNLNGTCQLGQLRSLRMGCIYARHTFTVVTTRQTSMQRVIRECVSGT